MDSNRLIAAASC